MKSLVHAHKRFPVVVDTFPQSTGSSLPHLVGVDEYLALVLGNKQQRNTHFAQAFFFVCVPGFGGK